MTERLYGQDELDILLERANQDGLQAAASEAVEAYHEGFEAGYAAAVEDIETDELKGAKHHLDWKIQ